MQRIRLKCAKYLGSNMYMAFCRCDGDDDCGDDSDERNCTGKVPTCYTSVLICSCAHKFWRRANDTAFS